MTLKAEEVDQLFAAVTATPGYRLEVDLENEQILSPSGKIMRFEVDNFRKKCLLEGLDEISLTLKHAEEIKAFEEKRRVAEPWLF